MVKMWQKWITCAYTPPLLYDLCRLERPLLNDLYAYLGAVAIVREKDVDTLVQSMGQCFLSVVEEYTDSVWQTI